MFAYKYTPCRPLFLPNVGLSIDKSKRSAYYFWIDAGLNCTVYGSPLPNLAGKDSWKCAFVQEFAGCHRAHARNTTQYFPASSKSWLLEFAIKTITVCAMNLVGMGSCFHPLLPWSYLSSSSCCYSSQSQIFFCSLLEAILFKHSHKLPTQQLKGPFFW